jgi:hypothetical protein
MYYVQLDLSILIKGKLFRFMQYVPVVLLITLLFASPCLHDERCHMSLLLRLLQRSPNGNQHVRDHPENVVTYLPYGTTVLQLQS